MLKFEQKAWQWLINNNYIILYKNKRFNFNDTKVEVDVIAQKNNIIYIIEIKNRFSLDFFSISHVQIQRIHWVIQTYYPEGNFLLLLIYNNKIKIYNDILF